MKSAILKLLRESTGAVSGTRLCSVLGISRVAVWKHIQKLQELGYEIEAGPRGYRLLGAPDALYPWEFPGREDRVVYYPEVPSTMDIAKRLARGGCPDFTAVVAGRQTAGRGRLRRVWRSNIGGLYFTLVLRPHLPVPLCGRVNFLASLTLARVLGEGYGIEAGLKWPNDILVSGRKLCGLLSEMEAEGEAVTFVNIGIGINVNNDPRGVEPAAVSLRSILGRTVSRRDLLAGFLEAFESALGSPDWDAVIPQWKRCSVTLGRQVRIVTTREETRGMAEDVDENGALILRLSDGSVRTVIYGDCFIQN